MTLQVGRVVLDDTEDVSMSGGELRIAGAIQFNEDQQTLRRQLLGLYEAATFGTDPDEPVVPVTWDKDPIVDGFWRVTDVTVDPNLGAAPGDVFDYTIDLEQVSGNPSIELVLSGGTRTNVHGLTGTPWHGVPSTATSHRVNGLAYASGGSRAVPGGSLQIHSSEMSAEVSWAIDPADYYVGAAELLDADDQLILGRTGVPVTAASGPLRVAFTALGVTISLWDGAGWVSTHAFVLTGWVPILATARVLRNSPAMVSMQVDVFKSSSGETNVLDVTLRRGATVAQATLVGQSSVTVKHASDTSLSDVTGGRHVTANDGAGNRWAMFTPHTFANASGGMAISGVTSEAIGFGLGIEVDGTGGSGVDEIADMRAHYMAAQYEWQHLVNV